MSALKKIRENVGLVIVLIAISLFAFIFTDLFRSIQAGADDTVAEIGGTAYSINVLNAKHEVVQRTSNEATTTEERERLKDQAWQRLVREAIYQNEWRDLGITCTRDEEYRMLIGQIYHPLVVQWGYFRDSLGNYNPAMVDVVLARYDEVAPGNPQYGTKQWLDWKQGLKDLRNILQLERQSTKWQRMLSSVMLVSDNEATVNYNEAQRTVNFSYVSVPYSSISDSAVNVTDADYSSFYNKYRERFKREAEVQLKYSYFPIIPSVTDSMEARDAIKRLIQDFREAENPFEYAFSNSDARKMDTTLIPAGRFPANVQAVIDDPKKVVGPITSAEGYRLVRVAKEGEDSLQTSVKLRHILVPVMGSTAEDTANARAKANDLRKQVNANMSKFGELAAAESSDPVSKDKGGLVGWVMENSYGPDVQKAIKNAKQGTAVVAKSQLGFHVVEVMNRTNKVYALAELNRIVIPSSITADSVYKRASGYHGLVLGGGDMDESLKEYPEASVQTSAVLGASSSSLLGVTGARKVVNWAFSKDEGAVNEKLLESDNAFVIAKVIYKGEKGYKELKDVKQEIQREVINKVKAKKIKEKLASVSGQDMPALAAAYGPDARAGNVTGQAFANNNVTGIGVEPKVVGYAFGTQVGTITKPISGNNGVYVIKVETINEPPEYAAAAMLASKPEAQKAKGEAAINAAFQGLLDIADIRDYRFKFDF